VLAFTLFAHSHTLTRTHTQTHTHKYLAESSSHSSYLDLTAVLCFAQEFP